MPKATSTLTLVYQIDLDVTRLLWVGRERTIESFGDFSPSSATNWRRRLCSSAPICGNPT